jgi:crotonobetainyl-CoA:carnitine CoA-transferase CaiB-like acyl-CoA transferase
MTLNLKAPEGLEVLKNLARDADVVVESFRPNVKHKLGVDYEALSALNPGLIYCSISGFGQDGPLANRPGFDPIAQGMSGFMSVTGFPETGPIRAGVAIGDSLGGIFAMYGILLALIERNRSGKGQYVSTSLLESLVGILGFQAAKFFGTGQVPERTGNDHAMMSPYGTFKTKDGHINIAAGNQGMWERLCKTLNLETLIEDSRFLSVKDRVLNRSELSELLNEKLKEKTSEEWIEILNGGGIACGPILNIKEVFENEQVLHLKMLEEMDYPLCGKIKTIGIPTKLSRTPGSVRIPPPLKGEHTDEVLKELGLSKEAIASYHENKIV